jgi:hypothetical protein
MLSSAVPNCASPFRASDRTEGGTLRNFCTYWIEAVSTQKREAFECNDKPYSPNPNYRSLYLTGLSTKQHVSGRQRHVKKLSKFLGHSPRFIFSKATELQQRLCLSNQARTFHVHFSYPLQRSWFGRHLSSCWSTRFCGCAFEAKNSLRAVTKTFPSHRPVHSHRLTSWKSEPSFTESQLGGRTLGSFQK